MGWSDRLFGRQERPDGVARGDWRREGAAPGGDKRTVTLNGRRLAIEVAGEERPTGAQIRRAAALDDSRLLIDGQTRHIVGPNDRPAGDELYDAPRFSKG